MELGDVVGQGWLIWGAWGNHGGWNWGGHQGTWRVELEAMLGWGWLIRGARMDGVGGTRRGRGSVGAPPGGAVPPCRCRPGEIKNGKVSGCHSWVRLYSLERAGSLNYLSYSYDGPVSGRRDPRGDGCHRRGDSHPWTPP